MLIMGLALCAPRRAGQRSATSTDGIPALLRAAAADPEGFRLLFRHAAREPEFRGVIDTIRVASTEIAYRHLAEVIPDGSWQNWAARDQPLAVSR